MATSPSSSDIGRPSADLSPASPAVTLQEFTRREWTDGVQVDALPAFDVIEARTKNTVYRVVVLDGHAGDVLVSGGRFFPTPARARLNGCTMGGSCIKLRGIYRGCRLEFQSGSDLILTTRVRSVEHVEPAEPDRPVH
jgi:hypothetical protein